MERCGICEENIDDDRGQLQSRGLQTIVDICKDIGDGLAAKLTTRTLPILVHNMCRRIYTTPSVIATKKRKRDESNDRHGVDNTARVYRSCIKPYNPYTDCFYCSDTTPFFKNCSKEEPSNYDFKLRHVSRDGHCAETIGIVHSALAKADERDDEWGNEVKYRLTPFLENGDLVATEAKYHHACQVNRVNLGYI